MSSNNRNWSTDHPERSLASATSVIKPGDVVVTNCGLYQHWSLVTDRVCDSGKPMLISASGRTGTVREECWDTVIQDKFTYVVDIEFKEPLSEVLKNARSQIGQWAYSTTSKNCEHFVKWVSGLEVTSSQVTAGISGAAVGATLVGLFSENPGFIKYLGGACVLASFAILSAKAMPKHVNA